jgi:hypothetical protein
VLVLGLVYGFFMGWYALINRETPVYEQLLATTLKVPLLFVLTLLVSFPSLYVFNALVGSRLTLGSLFRLLLASLAVTMMVLVSFGPITAFFSISTDSHAFMVILNAGLFAVAGVLGLMFLLQTMNRLVIAEEPPAGGSQTGPQGALDAVDDRVLARHVRSVFKAWVMIFALVGAQMSWVLRPFVGDPKLRFQWFRPRQANFFEAIWQTLQSLLG